MFTIHREKRIHDVNYSKLNAKNISNLVNRLAKRFQLDKDVHPQTNLRMNVGGLRYLVNKKYIDNSIGNQIKYLEIVCLINYVLLKFRWWKLGRIDWSGCGKFRGIASRTCQPSQPTWWWGCNQIRLALCHRRRNASAPLSSTRKGKLRQPNTVS